MTRPRRYLACQTPGNPGRMNVLAALDETGIPRRIADKHIPEIVIADVAVEEGRAYAVECHDKPSELTIPATNRVKAISGLGQSDMHRSLLSSGAQVDYAWGGACRASKKSLLPDLSLTTPSSGLKALPSTKRSACEPTSRKNVMFVCGKPTRWIVGVEGHAISGEADVARIGSCMSTGLLPDLVRQSGDLWLDLRGKDRKFLPLVKVQGGQNVCSIGKTLFLGPADIIEDPIDYLDLRSREDVLADLRG